ncbi:TIGR03118 family protein [Variovorax sp. YR216]|uniref:TIGR03118 family protein n=1 Tax=Variovorax sp. YR216 TaxID=1882828 RepID=UPI0008961D53|nr:TIGR03118 family protein [Variovorax sp. YR216]SEB13548.1 TIGR03118 family protein [Variovorax sp. YR216]
MSTHRLKLYRLACAGTLFLAACGGGGGYGGRSTIMPGFGTPPGMGMGMVAGASFAATTLVSDLPIANNPYGNGKADTNLINPWGVAFNPSGFVWLANNGSSTSTLYDGNGAPQSLVVSIPPGGAGSARPTGIVFNGHQDFRVTRSGVSGASAFIFVGQGGTLSGWSPGVDMTHAITVFDGSGAGAVYTGLAIASQGASDMLYAADFRHATVDMFDSSFTKVTVAGTFIDPAVPSGYAPFGIQAIGDLIYVSYARQDAQALNAVAGAGLGAVDAFDTSGRLVRRVVPPGGPVDEPWGMAMAPASFGPFSNALLVANSGSGTIGAFNPTSGAFMGTLSMSSGSPIVIDGLRGIAFGNGLNNQPTNTLFFAAGPGGGTHGIYGRIDVR